MRRYLIRRLLLLIPLLLVISFANFALVSAMGNPFASMMQMPGVTKADIQRLLHLWHWDEPLPIRFLYWLKSILSPSLRGGFSTSIIGTTTTDLIIQKLPITLVLSGLSMLIAIILSIPLGIYSALHQYSKTDYVVTFFSFFGMSMPVFWFGLILLYFFSYKLRVFPTGEVHSIFLNVGNNLVDFSQAPWFRKLFDYALHLVLPVTVLVLFQIGRWLRYARSSMLEVKNMDYIRTARAKGLSERKVIYKHIFRNGILPLVTYFGLSFPALVGGATITETIFAIPGLGRLTYDATMSQDVFVAMGAILFLSIFTILGSFIADILYAILDPRIRYQ
ncbi:MAG: ABC transporter permease [Caldiserica bacterium]|jgi:peptide/nickel transport system permease protein|nr:ABC transporter permease [Caldisericota bacterium]